MFLLILEVPALMLPLLVGQKTWKPHKSQHLVHPTFILQPLPVHLSKTHVLHQAPLNLGWDLPIVGPVEGDLLTA